MTDIKKINELVSEMLGATPLVEYKEPSNDIDAEMLHGLAQVYANKGFRNYIENVINLSIKNAVIRTDDLESLVYNKSRVIAYKELLIASKNAYESLNRIKIKQNVEKRPQSNDGRKEITVQIPSESEASEDQAPEGVV